MIVAVAIISHLAARHVAQLRKTVETDLLTATVSPALMIGSAAGAVTIVARKCVSRRENYRQDVSLRLVTVMWSSAARLHPHL